jgi:hypothetical protein
LADGLAGSPTLRVAGHTAAQHTAQHSPSG